ncbi:MAG: response regulator transcription factor [Xanthomonadaceae bacterium]|nr:response regulator transcription factor [Xanthomonadaceae bacterium]
MIRIMIADDHAIVREGLKRIIEEDTQLALVAEAANGHEALRLAREAQPQVILLDISMPERSGLDALADIRKACPGAKVLILSMHPEEQYAIRCLKQGADGYMTKESAPELLLGAIRRLHSGGKYVSPSLAEKLAASLSNPDDQRPCHESLSERELQVLTMIGQGQTVGEIANHLCVSVKTVSTYRTRLLEKMDMDNNSQLMRYAIEYGLA